MSTATSTSRTTFLVGLCLLLAWATASAVDPKTVVVAERGGVQVTLHEVDAQVMLLPKHLRAGYLDDPERVEQVVGGLLLNKQMAARAREWGVTSDPYYAAQLAAAEADLLAKRARALNEDELFANSPDFSQLAEEVFVSHPHRFNRPPTLKLEHVLVMQRGRSKEEALQRAETAREELLAGEKPFREIFNQYSDEALDPRGKSDGILSEIVPGITEKAFEDAVFALTEPGQVSEVIETPFGYHVARLLERKEPTQSTLEEVKPTLVVEQQDAYLKQGKTRFMSEFAAAELVAKREVVAQLRTRYAKAASGELPPAVDGSATEVSDAKPEE
jgi:parvulin-like peptidyl-prolyl isomerase